MFDTPKDAMIAIKYEDLETLAKRQEQKERRRILYAMKMRDLEQQTQYELEHAHGYCPICHTLRALNGKCMNGCEG